MLALLIKVLLAAAEVHHKDLVLLLAKSYQEITRLHVIVDQSFGMYPFDSLQNLVGNQKHCFESETAFAVPQ